MKFEAGGGGGDFFFWKIFVGKWKVKELGLLRKNIRINGEFKKLLGGP